MKTFHATGTIYMESTATEAAYDVEMEFDGTGTPTEMDVLNWLMATGDIQILVTDVEPVTA